MSMRRGLVMISIDVFENGGTKQGRRIKGIRFAEEGRGEQGRYKIAKRRSGVMRSFGFLQYGFL